MSLLFSICAPGRTTEGGDELLSCREKIAKIAASATPAAANTPPIDSALYQREDVREILAERDIGGLYRALNAAGVALIAHGESVKLCKHGCRDAGHLPTPVARFRRSNPRSRRQRARHLRCPERAPNGGYDP